MQTKPKSNSVITQVHDKDAGTMVFTVLGIGDISFDVNKVSDSCRTDAMFHGFGQRIPDAAAIGRDKKTGASASAQEKYDAMLELVEHYESGTEAWRLTGVKRTGNEGGLTIQAIARVKGWEIPATRAFVESLAKTRDEDTSKTLRFLADGERVASAMEEIRRERRAQSGDAAAADAMLEEVTAAE